MIDKITISVQNPKRAAEILSSAAHGTFYEHPVRKGEETFICRLGEENLYEVELLRYGSILYPSKEGAQVRRVEEFLPFGTTQFRLRVDHSLEKIKQVAEDHNCHCFLRASRVDQKPILEFWIEEYFLVEFSSAEIDDQSL